ncbi:MAG: hypothetical protein JRH06_07135 [Deltaproteobacteria bacterium]|nr:hypothetical protein [Deltaproteobacteria bacterium]MBW2137316.1 hypothetical protein [Deltaproteobacteria bacterium]
MLALRRVLQSVEKGLETLTQKTKDMQKLLDNLEEALIIEQPKTRAKGRPPQARKRSSARKAAPGKKGKRQTATNAVLSAIESSGSGLSTADIKARTGLTEKKIWDIVNRLKRQGKLKSPRRGIYAKA